MTRDGRLGTMVDWSSGVISPAVYFSDQLYSLEQERIFGNCWIPVGHSDMVREPGSFVTSFIGEVPIIIARGADSLVRVFVNRCRHRGNQVCLFDRGVATSFTCSYHGWTYGLDGRLVGVPRENELYGGRLNRDSWSLEELPTGNLSGLLFATLSSSPAPFAEWLTDDTRWWMETFVLHELVGGLEALPGWHRVRNQGNWKMLAENFVGDNYHVPMTHASWLQTAAALKQSNPDMPLISSPFRTTFAETTYEVTAGFNTGCPLGLGSLRLYSEDRLNRDLEDAKRFGSEAVDWIRHRWDRLSTALASIEPKPYGFINGLLFPNLALMGGISPMVGRHMILIHPRGAESHEAWQWTMIEKETPSILRDVIIERVFQGQAMAGVIAPDDSENFERIAQAGQSQRAQRLPMNFTIHLTDDGDQLPGIPGNLGKEPSEVNQRQFYRFWLSLMQDHGGGTERAL